MDRIKKFFKEQDEDLVPVIVIGSLTVAAAAVLYALRASGRVVTSCDLFTDDEGMLVIATHQKNGLIQTWRNPHK